MSVFLLTTQKDHFQITSDLVHEINACVKGTLNWLAQETACEITHDAPKDMMQDVRALIGDMPIDVNHIQDQNRRKKLLLADMDSTMINEECIDELGDAIGIKEEIAHITARAMAGELDFESALAQRVSLLKGISRKRVEEIRREHITYAKGGKVLVETMKAHGAYTALVSGGFTFFADYIGKRIGFNEVTANQLEFKDDVLTGKTIPPLVDQHTKLARLNALCATHTLALGETLAVGDGANDLMMIQNAGMGVAMHAKPIVAQQAAYRFDHSDLSALLYLQGYHEADFVR